MSLNTQSAPMEDSFPDNNEHMIFKTRCKISTDGRQFSRQ